MCAALRMRTSHIPTSLAISCIRASLVTSAGYTDVFVVFGINFCVFKSEDSVRPRSTMCAAPAVLNAMDVSRPMPLPYWLLVRGSETGTIRDYSYCARDDNGFTSLTEGGL